MKKISLPIHFHTHDTAGIQAASILAAAEEGLEIVDAAFASMSGSTSQVNLNTLIESLRDSDRESRLQTDALTKIATYWKRSPRTNMPCSKANHSLLVEIYISMKCPGGQYTKFISAGQSFGAIRTVARNM